jgi:hypothetical protein
VNTERAHRGVVLAVIPAGYLLVLIDVPILMAALPRIHADVGFLATAHGAASFPLDPGPPT